MTHSVPEAASARSHSSSEAYLPVPTNKRERNRKRHRELAGGIEDGAQVAPLDVLHRDEVAAFDLAEVVDVDDVRVVELGRRVRLAGGKVRRAVLRRKPTLEAFVLQGDFSVLAKIVSFRSSRLTIRDPLS